MAVAGVQTGRKGKFIDVSMIGDADVVSNIQKLPYAMQGKVIRPALRAAVKYVMVIARAILPRKSGRLASSLKVRAKRRSRNKIGYVLMTGDRSRLGIPAKNDYYYPAALEFGRLTGKRNVSRAFRKLKAKLLAKFRVMNSEKTSRRLAGRILPEAVIRGVENVGRRRIAGKWYMRRALMMNVQGLYNIVAQVARERLAKLTTSDIRTSSPATAFEDVAA